MQVHSISEDVQAGRLQAQQGRAGRQGLRQLLEARGSRYVSFDGWMKVDAVETERGKVKGKPREKMVVIEDVLDLGAC